MENDPVNSEAIFESLNLNPKLFINEALNTVDTIIDGAFHHFQQEASKLLAPDQDTDRSADLEKGVEQLKFIMQTVLDNRLSLWERYCLSKCFSLPDGFSLPKENFLRKEQIYLPFTPTRIISMRDKTGLAVDSSIDLNIQRDRELDEQLDSLINEIASVVRKNAERNKELCLQKRKSELNSKLASSVDEASQLFEQNSDMFEELKKTAAELREKIEQQAKRFKLDECSRMERISVPNGDTFREIRANALSNVPVEELEEFTADINKLQNVV